MRAMFSGGGTGGHLYPAIAIIEHMKAQGILDEVKYVGGNGIEKNVVPDKGIEYIGFNIKGLKRPKRSPSNLIRVLQYYMAAFKLKRVIRKFRPDFVFVTGGYASIPLSLAAKMTKTPLFNQEQNVYVGFANRFINKFADITFTNFEKSIKYFSRNNNIVVCGNPVMRKRIPRLEALNKFGLEDKPTIGIFGGSGGAKRINDAISKIYKDDDAKNYIHITGKREYVHFKDLNKENVSIIEYCNDMDAFYSACDFVIARAGAMTVSELLALKVPAILVPHPFAAENHQLYNARFLEEKGVAIVLMDDEVNEKSMRKAINDMIAGLNDVKSLYDKIEYKNSLDTITNKILEVLNEKRTDN